MLSASQKIDDRCSTEKQQYLLEQSPHPAFIGHGSLRGVGDRPRPCWRSIEEGSCNTDDTGLEVTLVTKGGMTKQGSRFSGHVVLTELTTSRHLKEVMFNKKERMPKVGGTIERGKKSLCPTGKGQKKGHGLIASSG